MRILTGLPPYLSPTMSSTSSTADLEMKISLEVEPHVHFRAWLDELASLATAQCADYSERGALHLR